MRRSITRLAPVFALVPALCFSASEAHAGNTLAITETKLDAPGVITLGVQMLISGDDNHDAKITLRYRKTGTTAFVDGLPLFRVHPEVVVGRTVPQQFAGSLFDLAPGTSYDIELHAVDPDGLDKTVTVTGTTRPVPKDPITPRAVAVTDKASFIAALSAAKAGDVITLANGTYSGQFSINASGTADNPIVIRGASQDGVILDGGGCTGCNVIELYGSFVHVEKLTIKNGERAMRFQGVGADGMVVRRVHIVDTRLGIGAKNDQKNFYICDNKLEGRLTWPMVWGDDSGAHANDDGIQMMGNGHVVCHNDIVGYGDAIKSEQVGVRGFDAYGNEIRTAYDNAIELDESEGNTRFFRNRVTNVWSPLSFQPIFGGPAYAFRNVILNVVDEQQKLHSLGSTEETVGALVLNNTFLSSKHALNLQTPATAHWFSLENNLYIGPTTTLSGKTVDWSAPIDNGTIDWNGWFPDGAFDFGSAGKYANFAAMKTAGKLEKNGTLLAGSIFASGLAAPADYKPKLSPVDATLAAASPAIDKGVSLGDITGGYKGAAPDLGALELGCPLPIYGVRPEGTDESNEPLGCGGTIVPGGDSGVDASPGDGGGTDGGGLDGSTGGDASRPDGSTGGDGGPESDSGDGSGSSESSSGCGCTTPSSTGEASWAAIAGVVALSLVRRRRWRR
jgi:MYXO-CTERM domain-containing protein